MVNGQRWDALYVKVKMPPANVPGGVGVGLRVETSRTSV